MEIRGSAKRPAGTWCKQHRRSRKHARTRSSPKLTFPTLYPHQVIVPLSLRLCHSTIIVLRTIIVLPSSNLSPHAYVHAHAHTHTRTRTRTRSRSRSHTECSTGASLGSSAGWVGDKNFTANQVALGVVATKEACAIKVAAAKDGNGAKFSVAGFDGTGGTAGPCYGRHLAAMAYWTPQAKPHSGLLDYDDNPWLPVYHETDGYQNPINTAWRPRADGAWETCILEREGVKMPYSPVQVECAGGWQADNSFAQSEVLLSTAVRSREACFYLVSTQLDPYGNAFDVASVENVDFSAGVAKCYGQYLAGKDMTSFAANQDSTRRSCVFNRTQGADAVWTPSDVEAECSTSGWQADASFASVNDVNVGAVHSAAECVLRVANARDANGNLFGAASMSSTGSRVADNVVFKGAGSTDQTFHCFGTHPHTHIRAYT